MDAPFQVHLQGMLKCEVTGVSRCEQMNGEEKVDSETWGQLLVKDGL